MKKTEELEKVTKADLDWEAAESRLKSIKEDHSIDSYFKHAKAAELTARYEGEERTQELYDTIMAL